LEPNRRFQNAIIQGHENVVELLLKSKHADAMPDVNATSGDGFVQVTKHMSQLHQLHKLGLEHALRGDELVMLPCAPVLLAVLFAQQEIIVRLLEFGADIDAGSMPNRGRSGTISKFATDEGVRDVLKKEEVECSLLACLMKELVEAYFPDEHEDFVRHHLEDDGIKTLCNTLACFEEKLETTEYETWTQRSGQLRDLLKNCKSRHKECVTGLFCAAAIQSMVGWDQCRVCSTKLSVPNPPELTTAASEHIAVFVKRNPGAINGTDTQGRTQQRLEFPDGVITKASGTVQRGSNGWVLKLQRSITSQQSEKFQRDKKAFEQYEFEVREWQSQKDQHEQRQRQLHQEEEGNHYCAPFQVSRPVPPSSPDHGKSNISWFYNLLTRLNMPDCSRIRVQYLGLDLSRRNLSESAGIRHTDR
jgi:hypothetical protein